LWLVSIAACLLAIAGLAIAPAKVRLSGDSERPCGTALRLDTSQARLLREEARRIAVEGEVGLSNSEAQGRARRLLDEAHESQERCERRQIKVLAVVGLGMAIAVGIIALAMFALGRISARASEP
jgi:hypothetical protein